MCIYVNVLVSDFVTSVKIYTIYLLQLYVNYRRNEAARPILPSFKNPERLNAKPPEALYKRDVFCVTENVAKYYRLMQCATCQGDKHAKR